jgi:hypothetical protein
MIPASHKLRKQRSERIATPDADGLLHNFVTSTTNKYLAEAMDAVDRITGNHRHFGGMALVAGCLQSYATLHAAQLVAAAVNRNTAALKDLAKTQSI